jgi:hypothetical protein
MFHHVIDIMSHFEVFLADLAIIFHVNAKMAKICELANQQL